MLHHRLLIGFLNLSLGNTVQKKRHLKGIFPIIQNILFLYLYYVYLILWEKSKNMLRKKKKKLTLEFSNLSTHFLFSFFFPIRDQTFVMPTQKKGREVLKFVMFTEYTVFKQQIYCSFLWMGVGGKVKKLVIF